MKARGYGVVPPTPPGPSLTLGVTTVAAAILIVTGSCTNATTVTAGSSWRTCGTSDCHPGRERGAWAAGRHEGSRLRRRAAHPSRPLAHARGDNGGSGNPHRHRILHERHDRDRGQFLAYLRNK